MNEDIDSINRMRAVTISREYGSGGGEIATRLAKRLGWQLVDHALVERVAREIGTSQEEAEVEETRAREGEMAKQPKTSTRECQVEALQVVKSSDGIPLSERSVLWCLSNR